MIHKQIHFVFLFLLLLVLTVIAQDCKSEDFGVTYSPCDKETNTIRIIHYKKRACGPSGAMLPFSSETIPCNITCQNGYYLAAPATLCQKCPKGHYSFSEGDNIDDWTRPYPGIVTKCEYNCEAWTVSKSNNYIYSGNNTNNHNIKSILAYNTQIVRDSGRVEFLYKVDADRNSDGLVFLIDGAVYMTRVSYTNSYVWANYTLDKGPHLLQWIYTKNSKKSKGKDRAIIKTIRIYGSKRVDDHCEECPPGTFADSEGQNQCKPCPMFTFSNQSGSEICYKCPEGYYSLEGSQSCLPMPLCTARDYSSYYTECKNGKRAKKWKKLSKICTGGFPMPQNEEDQPCAPCPKGLYRDNNTWKCLACPDTQYYNENTKNCTYCRAGTAAIKKLRYDKDYFNEYSQIPNTWTANCYGFCPSDAKTWQVVKTESNDAYLVSNVGSYGQILTLGIDFKLYTRGRIKVEYEVVDKKNNTNSMSIEIFIDGILVHQVTTNKKNGFFTSEYLNADSYNFFLAIEKNDLYNLAAHLIIKSIEIEGEEKGAADMCLECPEGFSCSDKVDYFQPCPPGYTSKVKSETCTPCKSGTYNDKYGQPVCKRCGYGTSSPPGATQCETNCIFSIPGAEEISYNLTDLSQQLNQELGVFGPFTPSLPHSKLSFYFNLCERFDTSKTDFCRYPDVILQTSEAMLANASSTFKAFSCAQNDEYSFSLNAGDSMSFEELDVRIRNQGLNIVYNSPHICDEVLSKTQKTKIYLRCDPDQGVGSPVLLTKFESDDDLYQKCLIEYEWKSIVACPACTKLDYDSALSQCENGERVRKYFIKKGIKCYAKGITPTSSPLPPDEKIPCPVCTKDDYYAIDTKCIDGKYTTTFAWKEPKNCSGGVILPSSIEKPCDEVELAVNTAFILVGIASGIFILLFGGLIYMHRKHQQLYTNYVLLSNHGNAHRFENEPLEEDEEELEDLE
jgi:hypothetical protein